VLVSGAQSLKMVFYCIHLPANSLHLIPLVLLTWRKQVHHGVTYHCQRNFTNSFLLIPRKEIRILANYSRGNWLDQGFCFMTHMLQDLLQQKGVLINVTENILQITVK